MPGRPDRAEVDPAEILAPAPVLALVAFGCGVGFHLLRPVGLLPSPANYAVGGVLVAVGAGVLAWGIRTMRGIDMSPDHADEPPTLITSGPFRYSRNPLYLGVTVVYAGLTAILDSVWPVLPLAVLVWYFDRVARREEAYLRERFGDEFEAYAEDVRRWL